MNGFVAFGINEPDDERARKMAVLEDKFNVIERIIDPILTAQEALVSVNDHI